MTKSKAERHPVCSTRPAPFVAGTCSKAEAFYGVRTYSYFNTYILTFSPLLLNTAIDGGGVGVTCCIRIPYRIMAAVYMWLRLTSTALLLCEDRTSSKALPILVISVSVGISCIDKAPMLHNLV